MYLEQSWAASIWNKCNGKGQYEVKISARKDKAVVRLVHKAYIISSYM